MKNYKIAIHQYDKKRTHSGSWTNEWINYCVEKKISYKVVNCFSIDIIQKLKAFEILVWHFSNYNQQDMLFARSILYSASQLGLQVFPDFNTAWHFDDKVAEYYLLKSIEAPIPESWIFYTKQECFDWLKNEANYPLVAKLKTGSGSNNVKLIQNAAQGIYYARRMFGSGFRNVPSLLFKATSNIRTANNWDTFLKRYKRIPEFLRTHTNAKKLPRENGYVYFQEFIPNNGFDLKVVAVGDKLSFLARDIRKGDFRASGAGSVHYNKALITEEIRSIAFDLNQKAGFQCMGYDFVIDRLNNKPKIVEISYGFSHKAQMDLNGHWDNKNNWHNEPLNAPVEVLKNLIK